MRACRRLVKEAEAAEVEVVIVLFEDAIWGDWEEQSVDGKGEREGHEGACQVRWVGNVLIDVEEAETSLIIHATVVLRKASAAP